MKKETYTTIDEYIALFPKDVQSKLEQLRRLIGKLAPEATEKISYRLPTFYLGGNLVHFGAFAAHIGFYPTSSGISAFEAELARYKSSKGAVQFPLAEPLPLDLIRKIVLFRFAEVTAKKASRGVRGR
jgi:uncharacterized protein YdhG (YjbR/CyaY superfamily)